MLILERELYMRLEDQLLALVHLPVRGKPQPILMLVGKLHLHLPLSPWVLLQLPMLLVNLLAVMPPLLRAQRLA